MTPKAYAVPGNRGTAMSMDPMLATDASSGVVMHNGRVFVDVNAEALRLLGATHRAQVIGQPVRATLERPYLKSVAHQLLHGRPVDGRPPFVREPVYGFDGLVRVVESQAQLVQRDGVVLAVLVFRDIADRVQAEGRAHDAALHALELRHLRRTRDLAGGVAHELNNTLQVIVGYASMLAEQSPESEQRLDAEAVLAAASRGALIVQRLLQYAQGAPHAARPSNLCEMAEQAAERFASGTVEVRAARPALAIMLDPRQLQIMLDILLSNATRATRRGGRVRIDVQEAVSGGGQTACDGRDMARGRYAVLTVTDTGIGMPMPVQAQVGVPFMSRWPVGDGAGLGLSAVLGMVAQHGGFLTFSSREAQGSSFRLWFPLPTAMRRLAPTDVKQDLAVVEHDAAQRDALARTLERAGYTVRACRSGEEVLASMRHGAPPAVLLCSAHLPGGGAAKVLQQLAVAWSHVPVLVLGTYGATLATSSESPLAAVPSRDGAPVRWLRGPAPDSVLLMHVQDLLLASES